MKRVLFYSSVKDKSLFQIQKFYSIDILLLENLNYHVILSNSIIDALAFWKYDFVFAYFYRKSFFVSLIAKCFGKNTYFTGGIDALERSVNAPKNYYIQTVFMKLCYAFAKSCIIVSATDMVNVKRALGNRRYDRLDFSEHVIDVSRFVGAHKKNRHMFTSIVWMESEDNVRRKGVDTAIKVFAKLKKTKEMSDSKFVIMGKKGEGSAFLESLIEQLELSDSVYLTGEISEEEKILYLKRSEYYFQLSRYEGFGLSALEALAANNIVIHSKRGGLANPIFNNSIYYDITNDICVETESLIEKLSKYIMSEALSYKIQEHYSLKRRENDFRKIIQE